ncbi:DNA cytosine methyltransferase [Chromobacterium haemolyticum]|uniref:DNA cytosine methyltransferase n=1 Tax=Chromobacterium haemolyticum TaxID=394935 RepID=UPI0009DAF176|nr:DNA cytosine methyltransferase [Chromobacterium haemolyticum]
MIRDQFLLGMDNEIIVDLFAGGGGMSTAIEQALGRHVDIAINHDEDAISMHMANHPQTEHYCADVFEVCPHEATRGRPVGHLHGSPDCTHFSQAIGGQPRSKKIRGLGWVMVRWAGQVKPRSISMENVHQMRQWGPLIAKRCKQTGRVMRLDGTVAAPGERVPVQEQFLVPDPKHIGRTWRRFVRIFQQLGYQLETSGMVAANYGKATTRDRLFMFARRDGRPIVWPDATHFKQPARGQKAYRATAEHIDFSNLGESIFTRKKPLADATLRRIAKGMHKFVLNNPKPFIVELANWSNRNGVHDIEQPLNTITAHPKGGAFAVATPTLVQAGYGEREGQAPRALDIEAPLGTIVAGGRKHALASALLVQAAHGEGKPGRAQRWGDGSKPITGPVNTITASGCGGQALASAVLVGAGGPSYSGKPASVEQPLGTVLTENHRHLATAYMMQANGGFNQTAGRGLDEPATTITTTGSQQQLVAAHLVTLRRNCFGREFDVPMSTLTAGAEHHAVASYLLSKEHEAAALRRNCFGREFDVPMSTLTAGAEHHAVASYLLSKEHEAAALRRNCFGREFDVPMSTLTAGAEHHAVASYLLSKEHEAAALRCASFLIAYYGTDNNAGLDQPMPTATTRDRLALVTVWVKGEPYVIVDICLRMLTPRELYLCQGFPPNYIIDRGHDGRKFSKTAQVRMVGNSVSPGPAEALIAANCMDLAAWTLPELKQRERAAA